jgi:hypothetical protein
MMLIRVIRTHGNNGQAPIGSYADISVFPRVMGNLLRGALGGVLQHHRMFMRARVQRAISLPVPWAGDDRTRRGARDISSLRWVLMREGWKTLWPSSGLVSDVAVCLAFSGRTCSSKVLPAAEEGATELSVSPARPTEGANDGDR